MEVNLITQHLPEPMIGYSGYCSLEGIHTRRQARRWESRTIDSLYKWMCRHYDVFYCTHEFPVDVVRCSEHTVPNRFPDHMFRRIGLLNTLFSNAFDAPEFQDSTMDALDIGANCKKPSKSSRSIWFPLMLDCSEMYFRDDWMYTPADRIWLELSINTGCKSTAFDIASCRVSDACWKADDGAKIEFYGVGVRNRRHCLSALTKRLKKLGKGCSALAKQVTFYDDINSPFALNLDIWHEPVFMLEDKEEHDLLPVFRRGVRVCVGVSNVTSKQRRPSHQVAQ